MQIRVLGCSGSIAAGSRTTSFLLDHHILIDAGTGVGDLTLDEMTAVDHILVTHSHLDHVLAIGLLADSVTRRRTAAGRPPVQVHALAATIAALRLHVFNGVIWPDFSRLPDVTRPVLAFSPVEVGQICANLSDAIQNYCYQPQPTKPVEIPKPGTTKTRSLAIPTILDRFRCRKPRPVGDGSGNGARTMDRRVHPVVDVVELRVEQGTAW